MVLGEGGGGESLFILFLVSGVPELREGEASDSDPLASQPTRDVASTACGEAETAVAAGLHS